MFLAESLPRAPVQQGLNCLGLLHTNFQAEQGGGHNIASGILRFDLKPEVIAFFVDNAAQVYMRDCFTERCLVRCSQQNDLRLFLRYRLFIGLLLYKMVTTTLT